MLFIPAVIMQIFNPVAGLVIPIAMLTKEAKQIKTSPVIAEVTISKWSI